MFIEADMHCTSNAQRELGICTVPCTTVAVVQGTVQILYHFILQLGTSTVPLNMVRFCNLLPVVRIALCN